MSNQESYGPGWMRLNLMVHPRHGTHYVGGDKEEGEGDQPFKALKYIDIVPHPMKKKVPDVTNIVNTIEEFKPEMNKRQFMQRFVFTAISNPNWGGGSGVDLAEQAWNEIEKRCKPKQEEGGD